MNGRAFSNLGDNNKEKRVSRITLRDWLFNYYNKDELGVLFANMDSAMKYIHSKGYCIRSFNPKDIEILNNSLGHIRFNDLMMMPDEFEDRKNIVREDIGKSAFLQVGIYARCLDKLRPEFLKSSFNEFAMFLPEGMIPYYRGVIERNSAVYLGDYLREKRKRDLEALEKEVGGASGTMGANKRLVKSNSAGSMLEYDSMNTEVNDSIYKQLNGGNDAAFISFSMVPALLIMLGLAFIFVALFLHVFW